MLLYEITQAGTRWYHGSPKEISQFNLENVGRRGAVDQEGPGIYLTSSADDAQRYGNFIHTVKMVKAPRLVPDKKAFTVSTISQLIDLAPDKEDVLSDWDQKPAVALSKAARAIYDRWGPNQFREMLEQVWYDFYRDSSKEWLHLLSSHLKYDGFILKRPGGIEHFICFNPEILEITGVEVR